MLKLPPPIWAVVYVLTAAAIGWFFGWSKVPGFPLVSLGISLVAISWILPVWAIVLFRREGDVLVEPSGQINAAIVGVGGFLGAGEKDVAVNFSSIKPTMKNNKMYLTMDTSKDDLKKAPGFKYDSNKNSWVPDNSAK
jgi:hypothetical protein